MIPKNILTVLLVIGKPRASGDDPHTLQGEVLAVQ